MHLALGMAGDQPQQTGHAVGDARLVNQSLAKHHVATTFAMDCARFGMVAQAGQEDARRRKLAGMQFGIAARQPDAVGMGCWRFIGQRRKRQDFRPGPSPALHQVRIDEGKGCVARDGDALCRGHRKAALDPIRWHWNPPRRAANGVEIGMGAQERGVVSDHPVQVGMLDSLHQPQMALRQGQVAAPGQRPQDRYPDRLHPLAHQSFMARTGDTIEDHARERQMRIEALEAQRSGCC